MWYFVIGVIIAAILVSKGVRDFNDDTRMGWVKSELTLGSLLTFLMETNIMLLVAIFMSIAIWPIIVVLYLLYCLALLVNKIKLKYKNR